MFPKVSSHFILVRSFFRVVSFSLSRSYFSFVCVNLSLFRIYAAAQQIKTQNFLVTCSAFRLLLIVIVLNLLFEWIFTIYTPLPLLLLLFPIFGMYFIHLLFAQKLFQDTIYFTLNLKLSSKFMRFIRFWILNRSAVGKAVLLLYLIPIDFNQNTNENRISIVQITKHMEHEIQAKSFCRFDQFYMFAMDSSIPLLLFVSFFSTYCFLFSIPFLFFLQFEQLYLVRLSVLVNLLAISTLLSYLTMKTCLLYYIYTTYLIEVQPLLVRCSNCFSERFDVRIISSGFVFFLLCLQKV